MSSDRFQDGLVERILDDTGTEPGALPLMAFALAELYKSRKPDGRLTEAEYHRFDGVRSAIGKRAEDIFKALDTEERATLDRVFRELVEWPNQRREAVLFPVETAASPPAETPDRTSRRRQYHASCLDTRHALDPFSLV